MGNRPPLAWAYCGALGVVWLVAPSRKAWWLLPVALPPAKAFMVVLLAALRTYLPLLPVVTWKAWTVWVPLPPPIPPAALVGSPAEVLTPKLPFQVPKTLMNRIPSQS